MSLGLVSRVHGRSLPLRSQMPSTPFSLTRSGYGASGMDQSSFRIRRHKPSWCYRKLEYQWTCSDFSLNDVLLGLTTYSPKTRASRSTQRHTLRIRTCSSESEYPCDCSWLITPANCACVVSQRHFPLSWNSVSLSHNGSPQLPGKWRRQTSRKSRSKNCQDKCGVISTCGCPWVLRWRRLNPANHIPLFYVPLKFSISYWVQILDS